jgi:quinoprotein glucose dehydrogenase
MTGMRLPLLPALLVATIPCFADELAPAKKAPDAARPDAAIKSFAVAPGLQVEVWAAEPHLANPVAFAFDDAGRAYVAETYRRRSSALDIRKYDEWKVANL